MYPLHLALEWQAADAEADDGRNREDDRRVGARHDNVETVMAKEGQQLIPPPLLISIEHRCRMNFREKARLKRGRWTIRESLYRLSRAAEGPDIRQEDPHVVAHHEHTPGLCRFHFELSAQPTKRSFTRNPEHVINQFSGELKPGSILVVRC
jgi:hypothetical protein